MAELKTINIAYLNTYGQSGMNLAKQAQLEHFLAFNKIDILNCQETNIDSDCFDSCDFISANYEVVVNNANNKYSTCCLINNQFQIQNLKMNTNGRVIVFDINEITFGNVYLQSGNEATLKHTREHYS